MNEFKSFDEFGTLIGNYPGDRHYSLTKNNDLSLDGPFDSLLYFMQDEKEKIISNVVKINGLEYSLTWNETKSGKYFTAKFELI